jgi:hypothetical protein
MRLTGQQSGIMLFKHTTILGLLVQTGASIKLWSVPAVLPAAVPATCKAMMAANIACGPQIIQPHQVVNDGEFDGEFLGEYCNSTCSSSMNSYINNINTRCGTTQYDFGDGQQVSAPSLVAPVKWARDIACLTGQSTTDYCYPKIVNHTTGYCDDCTLKYLAGMLSLNQGTRKISEEGFTSLLSSCSVSPTKYPHSSASKPSPAAPM